MKTGIRGGRTRQRVQGAIVVLLVVLGLSAGLAKALRMPQEVEFFGKLGLSEPMLISFGVVQVLSALLLTGAPTRLAGACILGATLLLSVAMILMTGQVAFALVSLIPVLMGAYIIYERLPWKGDQA